MMNTEAMWHTIGIIGFILDTCGKLLVAYTTLMVHYRFRHEHSIDEAVFGEMKREHVLGMVGIGLIIVGASMELAAMLGV